MEEVRNDIENLESHILEGAENEKEKEALKRLNTVTGYRGLLEEKIRPNAQKYQIPFSLIFQQMRKYILCETEKASK